MRPACSTINNLLLSSPALAIWTGWTSPPLSLIKEISGHEEAMADSVCNKSRQATSKIQHHVSVRIRTDTTLISAYVFSVRSRVAINIS